MADEIKCRWMSSDAYGKKPTATSHACTELILRMHQQDLGMIWEHSAMRTSAQCSVAIKETGIWELLGNE